MKNIDTNTKIDGDFQCKKKTLSTISNSIKSILFIAAITTTTSVAYANQHNPFASGGTTKWFSDQVDENKPSNNARKKGAQSVNLKKLPPSQRITPQAPINEQENHPQSQIKVFGANENVNGEEDFEIIKNYQASDFKFTDEKSKDDIFDEMEKSRFDKCIAQSKELINIYRKAQLDPNASLEDLRKSEFWNSSSYEAKKTIVSNLRTIGSTNQRDSNRIINNYTKSLADKCNKLK